MYKGKVNRVDYSGPLLSQPRRIDELLHNHEQQIRQAGRRSWFKKGTYCLLMHTLVEFLWDYHYQLKMALVPSWQAARRSSTDDRDTARSQLNAHQIFRFVCTCRRAREDAARRSNGPKELDHELSWWAGVFSGLDRQTDSLSQPHAIRESSDGSCCSGFSGFMQPDFCCTWTRQHVVVQDLFVLACDDNMHGKLQNVVSTLYIARDYKSSNHNACGLWHHPICHTNFLV